MNIETGVFTTVTSGYYIVTYSASARVQPGGVTHMYLHHNGVQVEESLFSTHMHVGSGDDYIIDQGSRTVVSIAVVFLKSNLSLTQILHLLAGDTLDLRTDILSYKVYRITLCLYMAPAPYGL